MEEKEKKQNAEEEEFEEDEEEKEADKEEVENEKEQKDENNKKPDEEFKKEKQQNTIPYEEKQDIPDKVERKEAISKKIEQNEQILEKNEKKNKKVEEEKEILDKKEEAQEKKEETKIKEEKGSEQKLEETNDKENKKLSEIKKENEEIKKEEEEEKEEEIKDSATTYILKYSRKNNDSRESTYDKQLIKSKHCLFMIDSKIIKKKNEKYLLLHCHEIAAIYFDEIYEKKFSLQDLYKENRHFRIFDDIEEAKSIIDDILSNNSSNSKKIFIDLQENIFRLHLNIVFFDKENEVIFNVPKKNIDDDERIRILPDFLKEIQIKMNHLEEENKKIKNENRNIAIGKNNISDEDENEFFGEKNETSPNIKKSKSGTNKGYKKKLIKK